MDWSEKSHYLEIASRAEKDDSKVGGDSEVEGGKLEEVSGYSFGEE